MRSVPNPPSIGRSLLWCARTRPPPKGKHTLQAHAHTERAHVPEIVVLVNEHLLDLIVCRIRATGIDATLAPPNGIRIATGFEDAADVQFFPGLSDPSYRRHLLHYKTGRGHASHASLCLRRQDYQARHLHDCCHKQRTHPRHKYGDAHSPVSRERCNTVVLSRSDRVPTSQYHYKQVEHRGFHESYSNRDLQQVWPHCCFFRPGDDAMLIS